MQEQEVLKIGMFGHVDHGKSTLIGRLLYETDALSTDIRAEVDQEMHRTQNNVEFAMILDALEEEQENEMTIDTTQRYLKTDKRQYIIVDHPGHKEFLKNMMTGASHVDAGILLLDCVQGIQEQTKRHIFLISLLGVKHIIVAINKMDLVGYKKDVFYRFEQEIRELFSDVSVEITQVLPISAKKGDNVSTLSKEMSWYQGQTLLEALDHLPSPHERVKQPLRFLIQDMYENGIAVGKVESGSIESGMTLTHLPSQSHVTLNSIEKFNEPSTSAHTGECIGITCPEQSLKRGDILVEYENAPRVTKEFSATIFWLSEKPHDISQPLELFLGTQQANAKIQKIEKKIDSSTLQEIHEKDSAISHTDVAQVVFETDSPLITDETLPFLSQLVIVKDNAAVAGGVI